MTKRILLALVALVTLALTFSSCNEDKKDKIRLRVEPQELSIMMGSTAQLSVTVAPADTKYTFESANKEIATVDEKGLVTAVAVGETAIMVKAGDITKKARVKVLDPKGILDSRYLGKDVTGEKNKKLIVPIYMIEFSKLNDSEELLKEANGRYGWVFHNRMAIAHNVYSYIFRAPTDDKGNEKDGRLIAQITYVFNMENNSGSLSFFSKTFSGTDVIKEASEGNAKAEGTIKEIAALYGFDSVSGFGKDEDGKLCFRVDNTKQFPEGSYEMTMISRTSSGRYGLTMKIELKGHK